MLRLDSLPEATRRVFDQLATNVALRDFTLIGGTALALQIAHRHSEDFDFWMFGERLHRIFRQFHRAPPARSGRAY